MNRRTKRWLAAAGTISIVSLVVIAVTSALAPLIGGQRANDMVLIDAAQPILMALDRYRHEHDCYPGEGDPSLAAYLPATIKLTRSGRRTQLYTDSEVNSWLYERNERDCLAYTLSRKLSWDPRLIYRRAGTKGQWVVDPGDGGAEQILETAQ